MKSLLPWFFAVALVAGCGPTPTVATPTPDVPTPDVPAPDAPALDAPAPDVPTPDVAPACDPGRSRCGDICVDTATDTMNCGDCGRVCASGQTCAAGSCAGGVTCPADRTLCGSACADLRADPSHCGACGRACAAEQTCAAGMCVAARPTCAADQTDCAPSSPAPTCVNTMTDVRNCGACVAPCPAGATCVGGACRCPTGRTLCDRACVDTQSDAAQCGRCGNACPAGQVCAAGVCGCADGATLCGGQCLDTRTDTRNCGACGRACPGGQACVAGACACGAGQTFCGAGFLGRCTNLTTDRANCGACGTLCTSGQSCVAGRCACAAGQTLCGATCVDTATSASHCGRCANACAAGTSCAAGACRGTPPPNDTRAGATEISLRGAPQTLTADTTSARNDTHGLAGCDGNDVFFRFVLTAPEVVYADTFGTAWDTALFLQDAAGDNPRDTLFDRNVFYNDDNATAGLCAPVGAGAQSQVVAWLPAGTWYLVLSGCGAGPATIHFHDLPAGNALGSRLTPDGAPHALVGATSGVGARGTAACCASGPEATHFWVTCPGSPAGAFYASSCDPASAANLTTAFNPSLAYDSSARGPSAGVCNDDTGGVCGSGATITSPVPATDAVSASLNVLRVDGCGAAGGSYSMRYAIGACGSGLLCDATCVAPESDERHCGGCNRRCAAEQTCVAGVCRAGIVGLPGETRFNAIPVTSASATFMVNTSAYRPDTTGTCTCTTGRDVFYQLTLTQPSVVYADTFGSALDAALFFQDAAGNNLAAANLPNGATCNDNGLAGCATGANAQIMARLEPGTYFVVLSGCGAGGSTELRVQRVPVGSGALRYLEPGNTVVTGATGSGAGRVTGACCSSGAEDTYVWYTCPSALARGFTASTCDRATWNTSLSQLSPARPTASVCNDDVGGLCGNRSSLTAAIPAGAGLHALYVDGCAAGGPYSVSVSR